MLSCLRADRTPAPIVQLRLFSARSGCATTALAVAAQSYALVTATCTGLLAGLISRSDNFRIAQRTSLATVRRETLARTDARAIAAMRVNQSNDRQYQRDYRDMSSNFPHIFQYRQFCFVVNNCSLQKKTRNPLVFISPRDPRLSARNEPSSEMTR